MAHAMVRTKLPLDRWRELMGINPLHFNQVIFGDQPVCSNIQPQYTWQEADRVSREEIAEAIAEAEALMEQYLNYRLLPTWEVSEQHTLYHQVHGLVGWQDLHARWGHFISGGVKAQTLIEASSSITYEDNDEDGYEETATVSALVPAGTDPNEVVIFYPDKDGAEQWEIRPIRVSVSGTIATITFRREQAVIPDLTEAVSEVVAAQGTDDDAFLDSVDVYRRYNDPSAQARLLYSSRFTNPASQTAVLLPKDIRGSLLHYEPATWNGSAFVRASSNGLPDSIELSYYAGYRDLRLLDSIHVMDERIERAVAYLAAACLDRPPCDCSSSSWAYWNHDMHFEGTERTYIADLKQIETPLGYRRGQVYAWNRIQELRTELGAAAFG
jgi:hypothetical protein